MVVLQILEGSAFCAGIAMGTASILSVGPNNLTLVREGLVRGRVALVASVMWASYMVILLSALVLADKIAVRGALIRPVLSWLGLVALCWFAFLSFRAYATARTTLSQTAGEREATGHCIRRIIAVVWLNPLTYVELLFIPAAICCSFVMPVCRILFIVGLIIMATVACYGYSFGGGLCAPLFRRRNIMRAFDLSSGLLLSAMAIIMATALGLRPN